MIKILATSLIDTFISPYVSPQANSLDRKLTVTNTHVFFGLLCFALVIAPEIIVTWVSAEQEILLFKLCGALIATLAAVRALYLDLEYGESNCRVAVGTVARYSFVLLCLVFFFASPVLSVIAFPDFISWYSDLIASVELSWQGVLNGIVAFFALFPFLIMGFAQLAVSFLYIVIGFGLFSLIAWASCKIIMRCGKIAPRTIRTACTIPVVMSILMGTFPRIPIMEVLFGQVAQRSPIAQGIVGIGLLIFSLVTRAEQVELDSIP